MAKLPSVDWVIPFHERHIRFSTGADPLPTLRDLVLMGQIPDDTVVRKGSQSWDLFPQRVATSLSKADEEAGQCEGMRIDISGFPIDTSREEITGLVASIIDDPHVSIIPTDSGLIARVTDTVEVCMGLLSTPIYLEGHGHGDYESPRLQTVRRTPAGRLKAQR